MYIRTHYYRQILIKLGFSRQIFEKSSNFMTIRPLEAELFYAHGQADRTKLIVALRSLTKAPEI
jgi:hypothetical protein